MVTLIMTPIIYGPCYIETTVSWKFDENWLKTEKRYMTWYMYLFILGKKASAADYRKTVLMMDNKICFYEKI